jgi:hypothetical protein
MSPVSTQKVLEAITHLKTIIGKRDFNNLRKNPRADTLKCEYDRDTRIVHNNTAPKRADSPESNMSYIYSCGNSVLQCDRFVFGNVISKIKQRVNTAAAQNVNRQDRLVLKSYEIRLHVARNPWGRGDVGKKP